MADREPYEGMASATGEHRTTGQRAWCFECGEWCYPEQPCVCCARTTPDTLRAWVRRLLDEGGVDDVLVPRAQLSVWAQAIEDEVGLDDVVVQLRELERDRCRP
ncbi:MAG: hypothetical protein ACYCS4_07915 [Acidimicrobiales bacterium]